MWGVGRGGGNKKIVCLIGGSRKRGSEVEGEESRRRLKGEGCGSRCGGGGTEGQLVSLVLRCVRRVGWELGCD